MDRSGGDWGCREGLGSEPFLPLAGDEFVDTVGGMALESEEDVPEVGERIAEQDRGVAGAVLAAGEHPVLTADDHLLHLAFRKREKTGLIRLIVADHASRPGLRC